MGATITEGVVASACGDVSQGRVSAEVTNEHGLFFLGLGCGTLIFQFLL